MTDILIAVFLMAIVGIVWRSFCYETPQDLIFLTIALSYLSSVGNVIDNVMIVRLRHLIFPLFIISIWLIRSQIMKHGKDIVITGILIYLLLYLGSFWGQYTWAFLHLKFRACMIACCFLLAGTSINSHGQYRKLLLSLLPVSVMVIIYLSKGEQTFSDVDRLMIEEINSNAIAVYAGLASVIILATIININLLRPIRYALFIPMIHGFITMLQTGSRGGTISIMACVVIQLLMVRTTLTRFLLIGIPLGAVAVLGGIQIWSGLSINVQGRLFDVSNLSGRDEVWRLAWELLREYPWYGMGSYVQGTIIGSYGDAYGGVAWGSMLNIYMDVILELGMLGMFVGGVFLALLFQRLFVICRSSNYRLSVIYSVIGFCCFGLLSGLGESMVLRAPHPANMMFLIAVGMLSQMVPSRARMYCPATFIRGIRPSERVAINHTLPTNNVMSDSNV